MNTQELRSLIREEIQKTLKEAAASNALSKLDPNKKLYWFEYYPHHSGQTFKAEATLSVKMLLTLKKLFDADDMGAFNRILNAASKNNKFYFTSDVFNEYWDKLSKALASNKPYGDVAQPLEEGSFAISPNNMAEAKKIVKDIEAKQAEDE